MTPPQVLVKPQRAQPLYARHPWVFAGSVERVAGEPADGDAVEVRTATGDYIATGLYNSRSKIRVRLYSWQKGEELGREFFKAKLERAIALRHDVLKLNTGPSAAYRLVFSESDGLSALVADRYGDFLTVQFTSLGLAGHRAVIGELLAELTGVRGVYLRTEKGVGTLEGLELRDGPLWGETPPGEVLVEEHGLTFAVNLTEGQKTGYYLDQRDNRAAFAKLTMGRRVLDAFSYSGGFGLAAMKAGAAEAECVDASEAAIRLAGRNAERNGLTLTLAQDDVFGHFDKLIASGQKFGAIVLDPPKFARDRAAVPKALQGYKRLHAQAFKLLEPGGVLASCCCSGLVTLETFEEVIAASAASARRDLQILERRGPAPDHPIAAACRETGYLKCLISRA